MKKVVLISGILLLPFLGLTQTQNESKEEKKEQKEKENVMLKQQVKELRRRILPTEDGNDGCEGVRYSITSRYYGRLRRSRRTESIGNSKGCHDGFFYFALLP